MSTYSHIGNAVLFHGDCLQLLPGVAANSVDLIATDPPYGSTQCAWDAPLPLDTLWSEFQRILAPGGCVVMTATMPFAAVVTASNLPWFRHDIVWVKNRATGHLNAKRRPLRIHEHVLVFSPGRHVYNPQKTTGHKPVNPFYTRNSGECFGKAERNTQGGGQTSRYPLSVQHFPVVSNIGKSRLHATQKPLELFEWIVMTYSNPGDLVLDCCCGSGTTGLASLRLGRGFIGMELDAACYETARARLEAEQ